MKEILDLTVEELIEMGAKVSVDFFEHETKSDARETMELFSELGEMEFREFKGETKSTHWFQIQDEGIEVTAFYDNPNEENDTEHAQAELTEQKRGKSLYEQKLEEAGHEEEDFA